MKQAEDNTDFLPCLASHHWWCFSFARIVPSVDKQVYAQSAQRQRLHGLNADKRPCFQARRRALLLYLAAREVRAVALVAAVRTVSLPIAPELLGDAAPVTCTAETREFMHSRFRGTQQIKERTCSFSKICINLSSKLFAKSRSSNPSMRRGITHCRD